MGRRLRRARAPARAWERSRYDAPYLRDLLLDHAILVDTLETATTWDRYLALYAAVRDAIATALGERSLVMAHLSHSYPHGGSIYFTFLARQEEGHEIEQWERAKTAATQTIIDNGGGPQPPPRHRQRPPALDGGLPGPGRRPRPGRPQAGLRPPGHHEPGQAHSHGRGGAACLGSRHHRGLFSPHTRAANVQRFQRDKFDIAIVGGGITGAGIARDAALRGLSVALLEKGDFGSGTSSKSSRMVHGGLRYLRQRHVSLVRESLRERGVLLKIAPHLVHPFPFLLPIYGGGLEERLQLQARPHRLRLCWPAGAGSSATACSLAARCCSQEPALRPDGLQGGLRYFDCVVHDARLTLTTARSAARQGAAVANYVQATALEREDQRVVGVHFHDLLSGRTGLLRAGVVVNAAGPWCDELRAMTSLPPKLRPTKGVHVVLPHTACRSPTSSSSSRRP